MVAKLKIIDVRITLRNNIYYEKLEIIRNNLE